LETLEELKQAFEEADRDGSGRLDLEEFKILLREQLKIPANKVGK